jgi:chromosome partitioning protein
MGKTIAVSNLKGGTSKTMTAASLGAGLAKQGKRVLLLDADSQHSLTISFGVTDPDKQPITLTTMMQGVISETDFDPTAGIIHHSDGVDLLPSNSSLAGMEIALAGQIGRESFLRQYIDMVKPLYDYVVLDCAPSLELLTVNALAAADSVIIPVVPKFLDAKGLELLLK